MKRNFFPPGGIQLDTPPVRGDLTNSAGVRSPWREYEFWYMVVKQAIIPNLPITQCIEHWSRIKQYLMENTRQRKLQTELLQDIYN